MLLSGARLGLSVLRLELMRTSCVNSAMGSTREPSGSFRGGLRSRHCVVRSIGELVRLAGVHFGAGRRISCELCDAGRELRRSGCLAPCFEKFIRGHVRMVRHPVNHRSLRVIELQPTAGNVLNWCEFAMSNMPVMDERSRSSYERSVASIQRTRAILRRVMAHCAYIAERHPTHRQSATRVAEAAEQELIELEAAEGAIAWRFAHDD